LQEAFDVPLLLEFGNPAGNFGFGSVAVVTDIVLDFLIDPSVDVISGIRSDSIGIIVHVNLPP
jgi:hypothetical protein